MVTGQKVANMIKVVQGQLVPRLTGQVEYYYSNCNSNSTSVKETVSIEMNNGTAFIDAGIKLNQDGTFNSSLLSEQRKYRVKIQGTVASNKTTQPIYIDLIYEIPAPIIS